MTDRASIVAYLRRQIKRAGIAEAFADEVEQRLDRGKRR